MLPKLEQNSNSEKRFDSYISLTFDARVRSIGCWLAKIMVFVLTDY